MMSNLHNILNPEDPPRRKTVKLLLPVAVEHASTSEMPSSPATSQASDSNESVIVESAEHSNRKDHEPHPDCPDSLRCLPDTEGRPQHTLPVILRCAILGSPKKRLTIREIYAAMESKYSYYKTAGPTWKQSVRHHLSLNRLFERKPRPVTDPGFGSYWTVNLTAPPGTKRPRKRGRSNKDIPDGPPAPPKKRGRPRKIIPPTDNEKQPGLLSQLYEDDNEEKDGSDEQPPSNIVCDQGAPLRDGDDFSGTGLEDEDDIDATEGSDDDYESEEELIHPLDRRGSLVGLTAFAPYKPTESFTLPSFSSLREDSGNIVDRMQAEIMSLRRQSAEAVSLSLRLSEQLVHAQSEASRSRAALRTVEIMLEGECKRRRDAERVADNEEMRRRKAEELLNSILSKPSSHDQLS